MGVVLSHYIIYFSCSCPLCVYNLSDIFTNYPRFATGPRFYVDWRWRTACASYTHLNWYPPLYQRRAVTFLSEYIQVYSLTLSWEILLVITTDVKQGCHEGVRRGYQLRPTHNAAPGSGYGFRLDPGRHCLQITTWDQSIIFYATVQDRSWNVSHWSDHGLCTLKANLVYFKRCARHWKNFKNLCLTLSERHQMFIWYMVYCMLHILQLFCC